MIVLSLFYMFICVTFVRTALFFCVWRSKEDTSWSKKFYSCTEVFEDSHVDPKLFCSFLTDPCKIMQFNYKNKIKSVQFDGPLMSDTLIKVNLKNIYSFSGIISHFNPESKIVFEFHLWPSMTRFFCELEIVQIENKRRYILRMKGKNLLVPILIPLSNRLSRKTDEKIKNWLSEALHHSLVVCEKESLKKIEESISVEDKNFSCRS